MHQIFLCEAFEYLAISLKTGRNHFCHLNNMVTKGILYIYLRGIKNISQAAIHECKNNFRTGNNYSSRKLVMNIICSDSLVAIVMYNLENTFSSC